MRLTWLAEEFRNAGLTVIEVDGWMLRGTPYPNRGPSVLVRHHTAAGRSTGNAPSVRVVTHGRPNVPGPLSNWVTARDGTIYLIASGVTNNAGRGDWAATPDLDEDNTHTIGDEAENDGLGEPWPQAQLDAIDLTGLVICRRLGWDADRIIGHREWTPRKIDPTYDLAAHRARVSKLLTLDQEPDMDLTSLKAAAVARVGETYDRRRGFNATVKAAPYDWWCRLFELAAEQDFAAQDPATPRVEAAVRRLRAELAKEKTS